MRRVRFCTAREERKRIQRRERLFASGGRVRFRTPQHKVRCSKLTVEGRIMNEPEALLEVWAQHFGKLTKSKVNESEGLIVLQQKMDTLASESVSNEEYALNVPLSDEEVAMAVGKLKGRKVAGPDGLIGEHLKEGGQTTVV